MVNSTAVKAILRRGAARISSSELVPLAVLFLLTVAVYWKIALTDQFTWMDGPDTAWQVLPWMQEEVRQWQTGHFPIWEPHHWGGQSLIGRMEPGAAYPLNWLLALFPLENGHIRFAVMNWYFVAIHYMGAAFCYALCRDLKAGRAASILAAVSFALCGFVGNNNWPQMISGAVWAPLIFLFLLRALRSDRRRWFHAAAAGACTGMSLIAGHHQAPSFIVLAVGVSLLFYGISRNGAGWPRAISTGLIFGAFTGAVAAVQILPSHEYYERAYRWVGSPDPLTWKQKVPYMAHMSLSFHPISLFGIVVPGVEANITPFLGITIFSLALIAVVEAWERFEVRLFALLSLFGIALCLGQYSILEGLIYALVPGMDKSRNVSFAILIFQFPAAILACFGLDLVLSGAAAKSRLKYAALAVLGFSALMYLFLIARFAFEPDQARYQTGVPLAALNTVLFGAVLLTWAAGRMSNRALSWWIVAVAVFEIGNVTGSAYPHREQKWTNLNRYADGRGVIDFLKNHLGDGRFDVDMADWPGNIGDWEGLDQYDGYTGVTVNILEMHFQPNSRRLFGVRYYVAPKPRSPGQNPVFQGPGINVYEEPEPFPRAWSVKRVEQLPDENMVLGKIALSSPDEFRTTAFLTDGKPAVENCDGEDTIRFQTIRATSYKLDADMRCRRMVIVGNNYFPDWQVRVDGKQTRMYEVDHALQGFVVPGGQHRVEVSYKPKWLYAGAAISIAALLGLIGLGVTSRNVC